MEDVLKRLYEIESAASAVKKNTERKKQLLDLTMKRKTQEFDEATARDTNAALAKQKSQLHAQIEKDLARQVQEIDTALQSLEQEYSSHHTRLAKEILNTLIKE